MLWSQVAFGGADTPTIPAAEHLELPGRGTTLVYEEPGPPGAPTIVLVHGLAATASLNWFAAFGPLSKRFRVLALDLRGHGRGIRARRRFRLADCADDIVALADVLGIDAVIPVGYSMGGPIAQLVWHRHPERTAGLVLCATSRNFGGSIQERMFYRSLYAITFGLDLVHRVGVLAPPAIREPAQTTVVDRVAMPRWALDEMRRNSPATVLEALGAIGRFSSHAWIGDVDVPTAVVVTTRDRAISPARQLKLARAIPGATVHPAEADHTACFFGVDEFVPALVDACTSVATRLPAVTTPARSPRERR